MVDYSKWKDIEISDDEDDTHPNIDTPSLFRWRHQARVERMDEFNREKAELQKTVAEQQKKVGTLKATAKDNPQTQKELEAMEKKLAELKLKEAELLKKEKLMPWNVDTISKEGFSKTVVNVPAPRKKEELSDEEREKRTKEFFKKYEKEMKNYGMFRKYDDSKKFLQEHPHLVCEETANYLVIWCINLEMEEKQELMEHVAHQCICMQFILELSKQLDVDPRACVSSFFTKIQAADVEYRKGFEDELSAFKDRIRRRAAEKLEAAMKEVEEEERQKRLGPGGLDPVEVFESLPDALKECFEKQDIPQLQQVIATMPEEEARYHMKRCVDSGLWVPEANKQGEEAKAD